MRLPAFFAAAALTASACAGRSAGPHLDREAPVQGAPYRGHFVTLPSGLRVVTYEVADAPSISISVSYGLAGIPTPEGKAGLAQVARSAANRGGLVRGGFRAMERLFAAGAFFSTWVDADELRFDARLRPGRLADVLAVEADRLRDPVAGLDEHEIADLREQLAASLERDVDGRADRQARLAARVLPGTVYAMPAPTPESVRAITVEDVRAFLSAAIRAERAVVVAIGPGKAEDTARQIGAAFGEGDRAHPVAPLSPPSPPPRPATATAELERITGKGEHDELWIAWAVPGVRDHGGAQGLAAADLLERQLEVRAGREDLASQVRWVSAGYAEHERAGLLLARVSLKDHANPAAVRSALEAAAAGLGTGLEAWQVRLAARLARSLTYQAFARLEDGTVTGVPELVRTLNQPDALTEWNRQAGTMPAQLDGYLGRHLAAGRSAALLVARSTAAKPPDEPASFLRGWSRGTSLLGAAAPGATEAAKLERPPGLAGGVRRVLPNGLTVVLLPRGSFPTVEVSLRIATDVDTPRARAERDVALAGAAWDMHGRSCEPTEARLVDGGVEIRDHVPAARVLAALDGIACWTRADPNRWQVDAWLKEAKASERRKNSRHLLVLAMLENGLSLPADGKAKLEPVYEQVDRAEAAQRFQRWFRPERATLVVAGRIDQPEALLNDITDAYGGWKVSEPPLEEPPAGPTARARTLLLDYPGSKTAWALVVLRLPTLGARDEAALRTLRAYLRQRAAEVALPVGGDGFVSSVDGTHLAYDAVGFDGKVEHLPAALEATLTDLRNLARRPLDGPSVDYARWWAVLDHAFAHDRTEGAVHAVQRLANHRLPPDAYEALGAQLAGVTPETVRALAASIMGRELVVVAGDAKLLEPELRKLGLEPQRLAPQLEGGKE